MENIYMCVGGDRAGRGGGGGALDGAAALVAVAGGGRGLPRPPHLRRQPPPQGRGGHRRREGAQVSVYRAARAHFTSLKSSTLLVVRVRECGWSSSAQAQVVGSLIELSPECKHGGVPLLRIRGVHNFPAASNCSNQFR